ncbi:FAD:protein FMN transferase [Chitiniphilus eburneus]|uniref:FAD:protein FMN transferase n=1 Tax=Chitiniphilus eburneus TaxID=2571148 RepID=UPI001FE90DA3|nr:FAD:protein FMN transferase [Chitiniphilus eburneus]
MLIPPRLAPFRPDPLLSHAHDLAGQTMGTTWSVRLAGPAVMPLDALRAGVQRELDGVVARMSHWRADSDLGRFNDAPAGQWRTLAPDFFEVLACAQQVAAQSDGAFDATVGALVDAWGFGPRGHRDALPTADEVAALQAACGWRRLMLDHDGLRALQPGGLRLDFSGIAKGYGVDRVAALLQRCGVPGWLVEVGGELRGHGIKPDGQPWWTALETPPDAPGDLPLTVVALHGLAVATSGDYRQRFEHDGRRYAHTLDPRSGCPLHDAPASVTVLHPRCMLADAYATALTVLGVARGLDFAQQYDLAARFLSRTAQGLEEHYSPAYAAMLE